VICGKRLTEAGPRTRTATCPKSCPVLMPQWDDDYSGDRVDPVSRIVGASTGASPAEAELYPSVSSRIVGASTGASPVEANILIASMRPYGSPPCSSDDNSSTANLANLTLP
jgi:hypothetical protein